MKALVKLVFTVIAAAIVLLVIVWLISLAREAYFTNTLEQMRRFQTYKPYVFDINDLLVNPDDPTVFDGASHTNYYENPQEPTFCKDLRNCIEMNIKGNKQCVITYKVKSGVFFDPNIVVDSVINYCPTTNIREELFSRTERKVCRFKKDSINPNINKLREDNVSIINYEPFIHNCYIPDNLGSYNVLNDINSTNYLYSGRGSESGYNFINGGTVRIIVTNVSINNDFDATCSYSLYICGQPAIAATENETPVYVFKEIQNLNEKELYYNEKIVWAGAPVQERMDLSGWFAWNFILRPFIKIIGFGFEIGYQPLKLVDGFNVYGYNPRVYEFNFNGKYKNEESLVDSIDAGMWEWSKSHYYDSKATKYFREAYYSDITNAYFSYSPIDPANISEDSSIDLDSGCWNLDYENTNIDNRLKLIEDLETTFDDTHNDMFTTSNSLYHIFKFSSSFDISSVKKIRMVLGIKKIFITNKPFNFDVNFLGFPWAGTIKILNGVNDYYSKKLNLQPRVILVMDPVTFCSA